jgi:hypothetical protein
MNHNSLYSGLVMPSSGWWSPIGVCKMIDNTINQIIQFQPESDVIVIKLFSSSVTLQPECRHDAQHNDT